MPNDSDESARTAEARSETPALTQCVDKQALIAEPKDEGVRRLEACSLNRDSE